MLKIMCYNRVWFQKKRGFVLYLIVFFFICFLYSNVMYWIEEYNIIFCRDVLFENFYKYKKGFFQWSEIWRKIVDILNKCVIFQFNVDYRVIWDYINVLVNKYKKKIRVEERVLGIFLDELSELDELIQ